MQSGAARGASEMSHDLSRLLRPRSIAVVGGGAWCANVVEQCTRMGFGGPVWPVHPRKSEIAGVAAFARLEDLPGVPDAVFVGVNRNTTIETVRLLADMGAGGAVCFASGFREAQAETGDGDALQTELLAAAGRMAMIGPNCYGFINYLDGALLWPDQHGGARVGRGVAVLAQSSNIALNVTMQARALPLAYVGTVGNQAQIGIAEIGQALIMDPRVTALGLHIEGIGELRAFEALAGAAREAGKPIVALKAGRSAQAQAATFSHTASLAGSAAGGRALLRRLGIDEAESLTAFLETLKLLHFAGPLGSNRIAALSCSGGEASLVADMALAHDVEFPPLREAQIARLRAALGPKVALANPLDYHTYVWNDVALMADAFAAMLAGDAGLGIVIVDFPRADRCDPGAWECVIKAAARARARTGKPFVLAATLPEALPEAVAERCIAEGLVPMPGLDDALGAVALAARAGQPPTAALPVLIPGSPQRLHTLSEAEAKAALAAHGLIVPRATEAQGPEEAAAAAARIGFPVALKGAGAAHKSEAGLVALDLGSAEAVRAAAQAMPARAFLVEEMIAAPVAELLIGVTRDPAHGFVLTLAAGGVLTEILRDSASLLLPVTEEEIDAAFERLRIAPVLRGYRGRPAADRAAIRRAVLAVQAYVTAHAGAVDEVEINPLICTATGAVAADALIRQGDAR